MEDLKYRTKSHSSSSSRGSSSIFCRATDVWWSFSAEAEVCPFLVLSRLTVQRQPQWHQLKREEEIVQKWREELRRDEIMMRQNCIFFFLFKKLSEGRLQRQTFLSDKMGFWSLSHLLDVQNATSSTYCNNRVSRQRTWGYFDPLSCSRHHATLMLSIKKSL